MLREGTTSNTMVGTGGGGNRGCYIRAVSDQPQAFTSGFNKAGLELKTCVQRLKMTPWSNGVSTLVASR